MASAVKVVERWSELAEALPQLLSEVVRTAALDAEGQIKRVAPVDTGHLRNSVYTVTPAGGSTYPGSANAATGKLAPPIEETAGVSADSVVAWVAVGANYGLAIELGSRKRAAKPFFAPGMDQARGAFQAALDAIARAFADYEVP